jgi:hypothetical protein
LTSSEVTTVVLGTTVVVVATVVLGARVVAGSEDVVVLFSATAFDAAAPSAVDSPPAHADATRARTIMTMVTVFLTRVLPVDRCNTFFIGTSSEHIEVVVYMPYAASPAPVDVQARRTGFPFQTPRVSTAVPSRG